MRMKHGSGRGVATSAKPRLLAAFTAVAMMFATAVPALMPKTAVAADYDPDLATNGGTCSPMNIELGDTNVTAKVDNGVATWVGRDMYVGSRPSNTALLQGWSTDGGTEPGGTYAAEAEGLTLVNGRLAMNPYKRSWSNYGFRFGVVGFGAQFRPAPGSFTLAVSGQNTVIGNMRMPANLEASSNTETNVGAWARPAFVGGTKPNDTNWYKAKLAGNKSYTLASDLPYGDKQTGRRAAIVGFWTEQDSNTSITWDTNTNAGATLFDDVNGVNYNDYNKTGKNYTENIQDQSQWMYSMTETGKVTTRVVDSGSMFRKKYNAKEGVNEGPQYVFNYTSTHKEKVIVFTGDGTSHMQVFNLKASELDSTGYAGVAYDFRNFPNDASIVVNVVNDKGKPYEGNIDYHNGWLFYWNPNANADTSVDKLSEISNGYWEHASADDKKAYSVASQAIMWNFGQTKNLSIRGGTYNDQSDNGSGTQAIGEGGNKLGDDPAAAMLGSIMVPHGSFDDHVTTNGRVWVGQDFMMNNPTAVRKFYDGDSEQIDSASVIGMDQERHNFSWHGSLSTSCSTIDWTKVGENNVPLGGTTWAVYNNLDAAKANSTTMATNTGNDANPNFSAGRLFTVTDNISSSGDLNPIAGAFQLQRLLPDANYYIRETATNNNAYKVNPNIYQFQTKNRGTTTNTFVRVLDAQGNPINNAEDKLIASNGSIINPLNGSSIEWGKTKQGEFAGLDGSEWVLTKTGTPQQQWLIEDDGKPIESLKIYDGGQEAPDYKTVTQGQPFNLSAVVLPADANQHVEWTADPSEGVSISSSDDGRSVEIVAQKIPPAGGNFLLTAIAADGTHQDSITIQVKPVEVKSITVTPQNPTVMKDGTLQLTAKVIGEDDKELSLTPEWVSDNKAIATVDATGKVTGVSTGSVTITATAGDKIATTTVTVREGTRIYADTGWANVKIYAWIVESNGTTTKLVGDWSGAVMTKDEDTGFWYYLVETTQPFYVIINSDEKQTGDTKIDASEANNTFKLTGIEDNKDKAATVNSFDPYARGNNVQSLSNARRKAKAARAGDTTPTWSHIDTTGWGDDKKLKDQNPNIGQFKLDGLSAGTYHLQENKAPDDYFINPTVYTITIGENGSVTWSPEPGKDSNGLHWIEDVPTEFSWDKVDAGYDPNNPNTDGDLLAGSEWKLEKFQEPATAGGSGSYVSRIEKIEDCPVDEAKNCTSSDKDHRKGKFTLKGLEVGKYRLTETKAPTGFKRPENVYYYFELNTMDPDNNTGVQWTQGTKDTWNEQTGSFAGNPTTTSERSVRISRAYNYREPGNVYWSKVSSEDTAESKTPLAGSEWKLTYTSHDKNAENKPKEMIICALTDTNSTCTVNGESKDVAWATQQSSTHGQFSYKDLPWGEYVIVETKAPDGYNLDGTEHTFTVGPESGETIKLNWNLGSIENTPGVVLPATGGEGNTLIPLLGVALTAISMLGCAIAMRKRI